MANVQRLSSSTIYCPQCKATLRLSESERVYGQIIVCPCCNGKFENKPVSHIKKLILPVLLVIGTIFICNAVSTSLPNTDKGESNNRITDQAVAGIKTELDTPITRQITQEETPTISITTTVSPTEIVTPVATVKQTPIATGVRTPKATTKPTPKPTVKPTAKPTPRPTTKPASYTCNCSKTCTQITTCKEAQYQLNSCGCKKRDSDHDGIACDGAPLHCQN